MPWILGVDEAGYGPNLGPFVMSAVACRVPDALAGANLWQALAPAVRRHGDKSPGLVIDDSKLVHSGARGLRNLEAALWAALHPGDWIRLGPDGPMLRFLGRADHRQLTTTA